MSVTKENLQLLKQVHELKNVRIAEISKKMGKSASAIRKSVHALNNHLPEKHRISISNGILISEMSYKEYTSFIASIKREDYLEGRFERLDLIITQSFLSGHANLSQSYSDLFLSLTTKKNDTKLLRSFLSQSSLQIKVLKRKGITIIGDELRFRMMVLGIVLPLIELDQNYNVNPRKANNPIENNIAEKYIEKYKLVKEECSELVENFLTEYQQYLNYLSRKLLVIYVSFIIIRREKHTIKENLELSVYPLNLFFINNRGENIAFNQVMTMLDFYPNIDLPINNKLLSTTKEFVNSIQKDIITKIQTYDKLVNELYNFFYKQLSAHDLNCVIPDKLDKSLLQLENLSFHKTEKHIHIVEDTVGFSFTFDQRLTIAMIIRKWVSMNKVRGRNIKNIVFVTNISNERIEYFMEMLGQYVEVKLVASLSSSEVRYLENYEFDDILVISSRNEEIVKSHGFQVTKINFFINQEDINRLFDYGYSSSKRRLIAQELAAKIKNLTESEIIACLKKDYPDYFI